MYRMRDDWDDSLLVGRSGSHRELLELIQRLKDVDVPVLIRGESGTGKELVARSIHNTGSRKTGRFVAVNCSAIPDQLLESELFGYAKGAFTGAVRDKPGLIEEADAGTFFLDEIGDLPLSLQAKLLRVLENKEVRRVGETGIRPVSPRFVSATNKDLEEEIRHGRFRQDLYYRLKIITISLVPLRERREDILPLLDYFLEKYTREMNRNRCLFSRQARDALVRYAWPGNVRELQNEVQRCLILFAKKETISIDELSPKIHSMTQAAETLPYDFFRAKAEFERKFIHQALARFGYNRARTAQEIGLSRQGLFKLIRRLNIQVPKGSKVP